MNFFKFLMTPNQDGDKPIGLAACVVVFSFCMAFLMHMPE